MYTNARLLVLPWMFAALTGCLFSAAVADAAATKDRVYQFGDDPFENGIVGQPASGSSDSFAFGTTDFHELTASGTPMYVSAASRPGASGTERGMAFDGVNEFLFIDGAFSTMPGVGSGGLGIPSQADGQVLYSNAVNWTNITNRYIDGWVFPTGAAATGRQDVVNDTSQFSIFITAPTGPDRFWAMSHGDPGGNTGATPGVDVVVSDTAVEFNQWHHVMQRSFQGDAVLYLNGVGIAHTTNNSDTTPENPTATANNNYNFVLGASVNKTTNFFAGTLDNFVLGVAGNNSDQVAAPPLPAGMNWGAVDMAVDNDYIRVALDGIDLGDVNLDGDVDQEDVDIFTANWLQTKTLNGFQFGDLETRMVGDFNFNGIVNLADAIVLRNGLIAANSGAVLDLSSLVPEPTSALLLVFGLVSAAGLRRRRG